MSFGTKNMNNAISRLDDKTLISDRNAIQRNKKNYPDGTDSRYHITNRDNLLSFANEGISSIMINKMIRGVKKTCHSLINEEENA